MKITVEYVRLSPDDGSGVVDVECAEEQWCYSSLGTHHGAQCEPEVHANVMAFGDAVSRLVREHFNVTPLQDKPLCKVPKGAKWESAPC
jgi:hypothetical protein